MLRHLNEIIIFASLLAILAFSIVAYNLHNQLVSNEFARVTERLDRNYESLNEILRLCKLGEELHNERLKSIRESLENDRSGNQKTFR